MLKSKIPFYRNDFFILGLFILTVIFIKFIYFSIELPFHLFNTDLILLLLPVTLILQNLRVGRKLWELGLNWDFTVYKNIVLTVIFLIFTVIWFYLVLLSAGVEISLTGVSETSGMGILKSICGHFFNLLFIPAYINMFSLAAFEELVFRGLAFQIIEDKFSATAAIISTSIIFAFIHLFNPNISSIAMFNIFLAGIFLGNLYLKSRSLYIPVFFHFGWNFSLTFILGSNLSGTNYNSGLTYYDTLQLNRFQEIIAGAHFGLEEGLAATFLLIILTAGTSLLFEESPMIMSERFKRLYSNHFQPKSREDAL